MRLKPATGQSYLPQNAFVIVCQSRNLRTSRAWEQLSCARGGGRSLKGSIWCLFPDAAEFAHAFSALGGRCQTPASAESHQW